MMQLSKSARYALLASIEMARAPTTHVTASEVAARYGVPSSVLAKVFQQLVHRRLALGVRGSGGGYRLARKPRSITVLDVIEPFEPTRRATEMAELTDGTNLDRLERLLDEVDEMARCTFASVTLETLTRSSRRPAEPSGR